jgi:thiamine kinase-like enzyme
MLSALRQNYAQALYYSTFARKTAEFFSSPIKKEITCLDALIHHTLQAKNSKEIWFNCISEIQNEPVLERISETANPVRVVKASPFLSKTLVFKESKDKEALEAEADMTKYIARVLPDNFSTAEPLHITDTAVNGSYTYVMRHASGETLLEKFKKKEYYALFSVAKTLALIHAKVPKKKVRKGVLNIALKVKRKLVSPDILLPREVISKIVHNYRPVFNALSDTNCVYNKDAHPENWLVHEKGVVVLDCENGFLVPQQFDLVNLLEYSHYLADAQKDRAIRDYILMYESHTNKPIDREKFKLAYFNAVIHRAISLCTAWSSRDRLSMHSERQHVIFNAICAIDKIQKEHSRYHSKYRSYYLNLKTSLETIRELVSVKSDC